MSRKHRVWYPGAIYHITARGNRRLSIFHHPDDYEVYLKILADVQSMYPFLLHSYCLMTNHLHLQIETTNFHIKEIMKELHSRYAVYFNKKYGYVGHVFQGRYGAELIKKDRYFLEVSRYIHRNPLEAKMVKDLSSYRWSSYPSYLHLVENQMISLQKTLQYFPEPRMQHYKQFVEKINTEIKEELDKWLQK